MFSWHLEKAFLHCELFHTALKCLQLIVVFTEESSPYAPVFFLLPTARKEFRQKGLFSYEPLVSLVWLPPLIDWGPQWDWIGRKWGLLLKHNHPSLPKTSICSGRSKTIAGKEAVNNWAQEQSSQGDAQESSSVSCHSNICESNDRTERLPTHFSHKVCSLRCHC